ncbi:MAG: FAD-binding oxidoreductase [Polaromonas sp.]|uniref:FAD-binding oxidoreductase n=1 Tax=Burkholderiales TaxID=80840 RepID=UPI002489C688|nr:MULTISPECIES: FAD-binding oxidoreductase [Burkholderiales]MDI1258622.1 FAD-binding oxidoreductase [Aquabacterium sp.]MDI1270960.1 FAD-binding oxidoreductase [Polaromonas sp.]
MSSNHVFLESLRQLLGDDGLILPGNEATGVLAPYLHDWRGRYVGQALAIARPRDTMQVAAVVRLCARHGVSLVPQGGNTSLVGGSIPNGSGTQLLLNLQRLNQLVAVDRANLSMTVQAGCLLAQVQEAASQAGLLFPLSLAAEGSCTVGGNLATNAGGTQVLRYGTARELCLGLEVVTAQGEVWDGLTALRKDNSGYDLRDLFIGSEGTLGIITAATLRLFPQPVGQVTALATCPSLDACVALLQSARARLDAGLTGFEVMHAWPLALVRQYLPEQARAMAPLVSDAIEGITGPVPEWTVLIDTTHAESDLAARTALEALLAQAVSQGLVLDATIAQNHTQNHAMWALREAIPMAERQEGLMVKHDIAVPTSAIPEFVRTTQALLAHAFPGCKIVCFGHLGDGNLHYNVQGPPGLPSATFLAEHEAEVNRLVYDTALQLGGTLSAEHGIGQLKRDELARRKSAVALGMMKAIKQALDPGGLMNPGRLISVDQLPGPST